MGHHEEHNDVVFGSATVLVNVGTAAPLVLIGTIERVTTLELFNRKHEEEPVFIPKPVHIQAEVEEEQFLIIDVTTATVPVGFPLTIAQLTAGDVAINLDYVIMILPVAVV